MAKVGAHGEITGIIGQTVHYKKNGEQFLRSRAGKRKDKSSLVKESRDDFRFIMKLIKRFKPLIDIGFKDYKENRSAYHSALSVNRLNYNFAKSANAVDDLHWFQFSDGNLSGAADISARKTNDGKIEITWQGTNQGSPAFNDDQVISCYWIGKSNTLMPGPKAVTRDAGSLIIDPGKLSLNSKVEVFISFAVSQIHYRKGSDRNVSKSKWIELL